MRTARNAIVGTLVKKSSTDGTSTVYIGGLYEKHQDGSSIK